MIKISLSDIWDKRKKVIIRIAIFLLAIMVANKAIYQPQGKKIKILKAHLTEEIEKNKLADEINELGNRINLYRHKTSAQRDTSWIINKIFDIAKDMKTEVISLQPQQIEEENLYVRLPLRVTIKVGYHELGKFLSRIENSENFIKVDSLVVDAVEASSTGISISEERGNLRTTLVISGIYLK